MSKMPFLLGSSYVRAVIKLERKRLRDTKRNLGRCLTIRSLELSDLNNKSLTASF